jgi:hypothetical protein
LSSQRTPLDAHKGGEHSEKYLTCWSLPHRSMLKSSGEKKNIFWGIHTANSTNTAVPPSKATAQYVCNILSALACATFQHLWIPDLAFLSSKRLLA